MSIGENIPWNCKKLVIAKGFYGSLPITKEVLTLAKQKGVEIKIIKTDKLIDEIEKSDISNTNFIIHLTC